MREPVSSNILNYNSESEVTLGNDLKSVLDYIQIAILKLELKLKLESKLDSLLPLLELPPLKLPLLEFFLKVSPELSLKLKLQLEFLPSIESSPKPEPKLKPKPAYNFSSSPN